MLLDTHISMPNQDPLAENKFSLLPRDLRKWIKNLPYVDQDQAVQQFYNGLKRSNRQAHSSKQRLAAIETMRPVAHDFLKQQRKYLQTQPFPLSKKANEVLKLQQNILNELAVAYKIIIQETVNRDNHLSNKKLVVCVHHAIYYQLEQYITLSQVYSEPPQSFWQDLCQLYEISEHFKFADTQIKNDIDELNSKSSPKSLFTQACLLSLSNLHTYGHGEAGKISAYINKSVHLTNFSDVLPENDEYTFYINLALAKPVRLIPEQEIPISSKNRYISASALIHALKETVNLEEDGESALTTSSDELNRSLAARLLNKLTNKPIRSSKRAVPPKGRVHIVIGLRDAIEVLQTGNIISNSNTNFVSDNRSNLELMPIESSRTSQFLNLNSEQEDESYEISSANAWDWISKGNVIADQNQTKNSNPEKEKEKVADKVTLNPVIQTWDISNASKGGYCLNSNNISDYQSQVGDIILLRLEDKPNDKWRLGVIRWMQSLSEQGVKMGIETLHGSAQVLEVVDIQQSSDKLRGGFDHVLEITEETSNGTNKTLITPPNAIVSGANLLVQQNRKRKNIIFQDKLEQTISFTRFLYSEMPAMPDEDEH